MIDFVLPNDLAELRERVEAFIAEKIVPYENDPRQTPHGPLESLRRELVQLAHQAGLLSPHGPKEFGGLGLDHRAMAVSDAFFRPRRGLRQSLSTASHDYFHGGWAFV